MQNDIKTTESPMNGKKLAAYVVRATFPVMAAYIVLGIGFGILIEKAGYGLWVAFAMSLFIYAGAMQYLAVGLLTGGASLVTIALSTLLVNARHLFYGLSLIKKYRNTGKFKPYNIFALTDETYALVCEDPRDFPKSQLKPYYFLVSLLNYCYWITGSILGYVVGNVITFNTKGIDFAMTALFITVMTEQWLSAKDHRPALIGLGGSALCLFLFGADDFMIPSMIVIAIGLFVLRKVGRRQNGND